MIVLGLILIVVAAIAGVAALLRGGASVQVDLGSFTVKTDVAVVFLAGAATVLVAVLGIMLVAAGLRRGRKRRHETKQLRKRAAQQEEVIRRTQPSAGSERKGDDHFDSVPREGS